MLNLPESPTLADFQHYVEALEHERGFAHQTVLEKCLLLGEEVGELFKAIRKIQQIVQKKRSINSDVGNRNKLHPASVSCMQCKA